MRKLFALFGLLLFAAGGTAAQVALEGQTFYYRYLESVSDSTKFKSREGVSSDYDTDRYITFTRTGCYESNDRGFSTYGYVYQYDGERDNVHIFTYDGGYLAITYYFSKDFQRLNIRAAYKSVSSDYGAKFNDCIYVFERAVPSRPEPPEPPKPPAPPRVIMY